MKSVLEKHSIGYWIHAYRRLYPGAIGGNKSPATIHLVRSTFEAAIRRHARIESCDSLQFSDRIDLKSVFKGLYADPPLSKILEYLAESPQLVLTEFDIDDFKELYDLERLAYQVWRCGATQRILGKGAGLNVNFRHRDGFHDTRTLELDKLVAIFDDRNGEFSATATGTAVDLSPFGLHDHRGGVLPWCGYSVDALSREAIAAMFSVFGATVPKDFRPNFVWAPFNMANYCRAHKPLERAFQEKYNIPLQWVYATIGAILSRVVVEWKANSTAVFRHWQRAYEGPFTRTYLISKISEYLPVAIKQLDLEVESESVDIAKTVEFLQLTRENRQKIDLRTRGPVSLFLPFGDDHLFIDYAWLPDLLFNLFFDVEMKDQNFKGDALEELTRLGRSILPTAPCKLPNGEMRQIDASFGFEDLLVIVECKAFARSFGIEIGDPKAIEYRSTRIRSALAEADAKAKWLATNSKGSNFDITGYKRILPVAVTPFVEYVPSFSSFFWVATNLPRVLTPSELHEQFQNPQFKAVAEQSLNSVVVKFGPVT